MGFDHNSVFWNQTVLQFSAGSPAVLHAVLSVSALHEDLLEGRSITSTSSGEMLFLKQYNKAIQHLRSSQDFQAVSATLICCILFVCLENFRGNHDTALAHLQSGLKILQDWRTKEIESTSEIDVRESITRVFRRLDMQATAFMDSRQPHINATSVDEYAPESSNSASSYFKSLQQAQDEFERIAIRLFYVLTLKSHPKYSPTRTTLLRGLAIRFNAWKKSFDTFSDRESPSMDTRDLQLSVMLGLHFQAATLMLDLRANPVVFENEIDLKCVRIINLSRSLINSSNLSKPKFSSDMGVIGPLYFAAMNASPSIRQQAIDLLYRIKGKEGFWDPRTTAKIAKEVLIIQQHVKSPGLPVTGGVQFLAAAHRIPCN
jgi:hypothetical protein